METLYEFMYEGWIIQNEKTGEDKPFFDKTPDNNHSAKFMSIQIKSQKSV